MFVFAVTLSSTCSNTEALIYCTSVSEERAFPVARSIVVEAPNQNASPVGMVQSSQVPACESGLLSCPLHQREVDYDPSFPGTIHGQDLNSGVESARLSTASRSSDVSQPQVSSSSVSVTGSVPVNNTSEVTASSTARLHLPNGLLSATSTGSRPLATRDNSSCRSISGTAFSSAVPRLSSQVNPPSISSAGVMGFGDSLLPVSINSTASSSAVPRLSSQINPPSTSSAGVMAFGDSSLLVPINSTASSSAVPSMTQITPPFISSTGVTSSRQPILPPLPLQLPRMRTCFPGYVSSIPLSLCLPSTGQQTGSPFIPGTHNVVNCAPFYPSRQYPPLCFVNSGQPLSNVLRENTFNSNPLTANDQSFTCFEPQTHPRGDNFGRTWSTEVTTRPNERIATWMTSAGHPKNRDDNGSSIMACHQGHVGTCSSIMGQDKNNVGVRRTSVGRQNDNDGMGNTSMGHQNEPVSTSSGHRRAHVGMSFASIAHPERNVGISSTSIGHQKPDHVSSSTASAEHEKDCVGGGGRSVDYEEDNNTIFTDEAPFSISSLLPELPDEVTSRTAPDVARQRRTTRNNREIVQEACSKLEKALSLISKRDVADYGWLQDRYRDTSLRQTPLITGVRSLKKFIERTELALKIENLQLQKSLHKLKNQINVYETNVRKETIKYEMKNALIEKRSVAKEGRAVKHKEAELEEMLAKIKVLSDEMDTIEMKWLKTEGTMLGFKQFEPGSSHDNGAGQNC